MGDSTREESVVSERNKILVTGATGSVGRNVVSELLGVNADVRAMVRTPETANLPDSVEVVRGDLCEPDTVAAALESTDAVFLLWAASDEFAPAAVAEISKHASRVVYLSSMGVRDDLETQKDPINQSHANLESLIEGSGLSWTFLRASGFASNTLGWADDVRGNGVVRAPYGEARRSLIHERDIAAVATRALTEEGHARKKHVITGSESVAQSEQARIIGEVVGCPVRWEEQSREEAREELAAAFGSESVADGVLDAWAAMVESPEPATNTVEEVTGFRARAFREWVSDHADDFR
ncbi:MAG: NAD(P)H-binding protein [Rubrobacter sp.]|jgi:uncharacterized protein YbjT (DUF2867 family)|nr:NAD(P)H-binding protein [Rubrobacter sp.]